MKSLFKKLSLGLLLIGSLLLLAPSVIIDVTEIRWLRATQVQRMTAVGVTSSEMAGDSIILYRGQPAVLENIYLKYTYYGTAYTTTGSTDTVKIYGQFGDNAANVAYIGDSTFSSTQSHVSYVSTQAGAVNGTLYYMIIPASKFTDGNGTWEIICGYTIFK